LRILVTGASGFVGRQLCHTLTAAGLRVRAALRNDAPLIEAHERVVIGDIGPDTEWSGSFEGVDTIVHLAARVHVMRDLAGDSYAEYRRINVLGSERLARSAVESGVRRIVYLSSIKVNGESSLPAHPFSEESPPRPNDPYAVSKWEAEQSLQRLGADEGLEVVIVRPPLVYGPGVRANFLTLLNLVARGVPLPLGAIENRRSLIYVNNLTDALYRCVVDARAANRTFLVSDGEDLSTPDMIQRLARALGAPTRLFAVPPAALQLLGRLLRREATIDRLTQSLVVDITSIRTTLGWTPPFSVQTGFEQTAAWFYGRTDG